MLLLLTAPQALVAVSALYRLIRLALRSTVMAVVGMPWREQIKPSKSGSGLETLIMSQGTCYPALAQSLPTIGERPSPSSQAIAATLTNTLLLSRSSSIVSFSSRRGNLDHAYDWFPQQWLSAVIGLASRLCTLLQGVLAPVSVRLKSVYYCYTIFDSRNFSDYVNNNPAAFTDTYFDFASIKVYTHSYDYWWCCVKIWYKIW